MKVLTCDTISPRLLANDLGFDNCPVPGPQFWDVDTAGVVIDETDTFDGPATPVVLALLFTTPADRKAVTPDMTVSWAVVSGAPDMADQFTDDNGGQGVYLDKALYNAVLKNM